MKRYKIEPVKVKFDWGEEYVISLGESGRGRKRTYVMYHAPLSAQYLDLGLTRSGKAKIVEGKEDID